MMQPIATIRPLTRIESFKFWVPVWLACGVLGLVVGLIVGAMKQ